MTTLYRSELVVRDESPEAAEPIPEPPADRYLDMLLAVALAALVTVHQAPLPWMSMVLPAMGVLAGVGGARIAAMGRPAAETLGWGIRRLVPPIWAMGLVLVPVMVADGWRDRPDLQHLALWGLPLFEPPTSAWAASASLGPLGVIAFLWLVLLSPPLRRVPNRLLPLVLVLPVAALWASDHLLGPEPARAPSVLTAVLTYAPCWLVGVARGRGVLRTVRWWVIVPVAAAAVAGALAWTITHPGDVPLDLTFHPIGYASYSFGFTLVLLRAAPTMACRGRRPMVDRFVDVCGMRAVTVLLWHGVVFALVPLVSALLPEDDMGIVWRVAASVVIVAGLAVSAIVLFGWVEDVAARRPVRLRPWGEAPPSRPRRRTPEWSGPIWFE